MTSAPDQARAAPRRYERQFRQVAAALLGGGIAGALVGGVGGRLAMRVMTLTSDERVKGLETDDEFIVGEFNVDDTLGLVLFCLFIGLAVGVAYLAVRPALPTPRWLSFAVLGGLAGGALIIHQGGIDFTVLTPHWLAVALFTAIPLAGGAATVALVDRFLRSPLLMERAHVAFVAIPFLILGPIGIVVLGIPIVVGVVVSERASRDPADASWRRPAVLTARILLGAFAVLAAVDLVRDTAAIV